MDESESIFESVTEIEALGAYDEVFTIYVMKIGPTFIVRASEFDDEYIFKNQEDAETWARGNYGPFIEALEEYNQQSNS